MNRGLMLVWRIWSESINFEEFADEFDLDYSGIHTKGEKGRLGRTINDSGMIINLFDVDKKGINEALENFLSEYSDVITALQDKGAISEIDIGVLVGSEHSYAPSFLLNTKVLGLLSVNNIAVRISSYPCQD